MPLQICVFTLFLTLPLLCQGDERNLNYEMLEVCDAVYGTTLSTYATTNSFLTCVTLCSDEELCQSAVYNTGACRTNSAIQVSPTFECTDKWLYAYKTSSSSIATINHLGTCTEHEDCERTYRAACRQNLCFCEPGLSYYSALESCISDCVSYGNTFQVDLEHFIKGYDQSSQISTYDPVECMNACLQETGFRCRTAELNKTNGTCFLSYSTATSQPHAYYPSSDHNLYQRDCEP